jgi:hypothetical protein
MPTPDQIDDKLQQQYLREKAMHILPAKVKHRIARGAGRRQPSRWLGLWRNTQLALSCALLLVFGYLVIPTALQPEQYYQIVVSSNEQFNQVQQHQITAQAELGVAQLNANAVAYQQYLDMTQRHTAFQQQVGLLKQSAEHWQISVCDELLLTVERELLTQLYLPLRLEDFAQQQWVEFASNQAGQLIAITPTSHALQCPQS